MRFGHGLLDLRLYVLVHVLVLVHLEGYLEGQVLGHYCYLVYQKLSERSIVSSRTAAYTDVYFFIYRYRVSIVIEYYYNISIGTGTVIC